MGRVEKSHDFVERHNYISLPTNFAERQKHDSNGSLIISRATKTNGHNGTVQSASWWTGRVEGAVRPFGVLPRMRESQANPK